MDDLEKFISDQGPEFAVTVEAAERRMDEYCISASTIHGFGVHAPGGWTEGSRFELARLRGNVLRQSHLCRCLNSPINRRPPTHAIEILPDGRIEAVAVSTEFGTHEATVDYRGWHDAVAMLARRVGTLRAEVAPYKWQLLVPAFGQATWIEDPTLGG